MKSKDIEMVVYGLVIAGAINWGLVGAFRIDLVQMVFSTAPTLAQLLYILIGLSGLYSLYLLTARSKGRKK